MLTVGQLLRNASWMRRVGDPEDYIDHETPRILSDDDGDEPTLCVTTTYNPKTHVVRWNFDVIKPENEGPA